MNSRAHDTLGWTASASCPATVFVIDADPSVRTALEVLITSNGWCAKTFPSGEAFLASIPPTAGPSCLIAEILLPGIGGLELQSLLVGHGSIPVIFLTSHLNVSMTVRAMKAGAVEFLTKPFLTEMLVPAVCSALERSGEALRHDTELRALRKRYATLSEREREVMELVVSGLLNKQIGDRLCISEITVKAHRGKVMRKMEADSLPALVYMAATLGLPWPASRNRSGSLGLARTRSLAWPAAVQSAMS
jgi:FixJ family two-component response regulator